MGVYSPAGNLYVTVNDTTGTGRYAADGSVRITLVSGTSYTGLYAPDGSMNVVKEDGPLYHPCGAVRGIIPYGGLGLHAPSGAFYMDGLDQSFFNLETEDGFNLLQEDSSFILLE